MLRGLELPLYAFFIYFVMDALGDKGNWIDYRNTMLAYSFINLGIGVFSFFTILIPVALNGYIAENVVDAIKLRFLASILKRDGAFFDKPETSNAKLVSMMNSDVPQIKSGLDHRLVGNVFVAAMAINVVSWALQFVGITGLELMRAEPACSAIIPLLDESIDNDGNATTESEDDGVSSPINGSVIAERIEFAYPARPNIKVANGLTFEAPEGQMIALVGPSGGGKSTIIALLERFYPVQSGKLTVDGTPVSKFNLHHLRNHMALVGQEPVLFAGTIKDNILLGIEDGGFDDVQNACRLANATGFIEKLPLGYETELRVPLLATRKSYSLMKPHQLLIQNPKRPSKKH